MFKADSTSPRPTTADSSNPASPPASGNAAIKTNGDSADRPASSSSAAGASSSGNKPPPKRLSCTSCRARKVKCDRISTPCGPCTRSGIPGCTYPAPATTKTRTGTKRKNIEIAQRISRLEGLVNALGGEEAARQRLGEIGAGLGLPRVDEEGMSDGEGGDAAEKRVRAEDGRLGEHGRDMSVDPRDEKLGSEAIVGQDGKTTLISQFWANISDEVGGLRQLLVESDEEDEEEDDIVSPSDIATEMHEPVTVSFFPFRGGEAPADLTGIYPYPAQWSTMIATFFSRFDPIQKSLHRPTIDNIFRQFQSNGYFKQAAEEAVMMAVAYGAVTTLKQDECQRLFREDRTSMVERYERGCEAAMMKADLLNSEDLMVVETLSIYVACLRNHHTNRAPWSLLGLLTRIATSLELNIDGDDMALSPFETQIRRRLWWSIMLLDVQSAQDRGKPPMLAEVNFTTKLPGNYNDDDLDPVRGILCEEHEDITDISFLLLCCTASSAFRFLAAPPQKKGPGPAPRMATEEEKLAKVKEVTTRIQEKFIRQCNPTIAYDNHIRTIGSVMCLKLPLLVQYPFSFGGGKAKKPKSLATKERNLADSVHLLELHHSIEFSGSKFSWALRNYVQWHTIAVILAELVSQPPGPLADRAWAILDAVLERTVTRVADKKSGRIWRPVRKLLERAKRVHGRTDGFSPTSSYPRNLTPADSQGTGSPVHIGQPQQPQQQAQQTPPQPRQGSRQVSFTPPVSMPQMVNTGLHSPPEHQGAVYYAPPQQQQQQQGPSPGSMDAMSLDPRASMDLNGHHQQQAQHAAHQAHQAHMAAAAAAAGYNTSPRQTQGITTLLGPTAAVTLNGVSGPPHPQGAAAHAYPMSAADAAMLDAAAAAAAGGAPVGWDDWDTFLQGVVHGGPGGDGSQTGRSSSEEGGGQGQTPPQGFWGF